ncbi:MAG TPA: phosphotransferase, partial [Lachnospiraceae bacterium]|nr:phosphotransferase [Lachnospiraceae bacterium]
MEAITKNKQSEETLALMIHRAFPSRAGLGYSINEMDGGFCNVVYLIKFKNGEEYVLKIAPSDEIEMMTYEEGLLQTEVSVLKLIEEKTTIPAPRVIYADETRTICNASYFFMTKVEGESYVDVRKNFTEAEHLQIKKQLGQMSKEMNDIVGNQFGIYSIPSTYSNSCKEFMLKLFRMMLDDGMKAGSGLMHITYEELWHLIMEKSDSFLEVTEPRLIHWDLWDGNIFVKDKQISGI